MLHYLRRSRMPSLQWRHHERDSVSNHQPHDCLLNRLFGRRSKKTWKLHVTGLCAGNSPVTGEFPAQRASYAENVSIWWRHHVLNNVHSVWRYKLTERHWNWKECSDDAAHSMSHKTFTRFLCVLHTSCCVISYCFIRVIRLPMCCRVASLEFGQSCCTSEVIPKDIINLLLHDHCRRSRMQSLLITATAWILKAFCAFRVDIH